MPNQDDSKKLPQTIYATILLALICSLICLTTGIVLTVVNWNNPIWDLKIKSIFVIAVVILAAITVFISWLFRRRIK